MLRAPSSQPHIQFVHQIHFILSIKMPLKIAHTRQAKELIIHPFV